MSNVDSASRRYFMRSAKAMPRNRLSGCRSPLLHGEQGGLLMRLCGRRFDKHVAAAGIRSGRADSSRTCHRARDSERRWHATRSHESGIRVQHPQRARGGDMTRLVDFLSPPVIAKTGRNQVPERQRAVQLLRALAEPYRLRVVPDAEGFALFPGRYGQIELYCDGVTCSSCSLPGRVALAVHTDRRRLFGKLWAVPGVKRHQTGDTEIRAVFAPETMEQVARVIRPRRRRSLSPEDARRRGFKPTHGATAGT